MPGFMDQSSQLLGGCCHEAERSAIVGRLLISLRSCIPPGSQHYLTDIIANIQVTSKILRDVADKCQIHISRAYIVMDYLGVILPCLSRTLRDITTHYEDTTRSKDSRWRNMYHKMGNELPGMSLPQRFQLYNGFLQQLQYLTIRSQDFDFNVLDFFRKRLLELRKARDIDPPAPSTQLVRRELATTYWEEPAVGHWAEFIFTQPLPSRREFKRGSFMQSRGYGDNQQMGHVDIPPDAQVLVKRPFDGDKVSIIFYMTTSNDTPWLFMRTLEGGLSWVDTKGLHELVVKRNNPSSLCLLGWDHVMQRTRPWADLILPTWEEMVLFYNTFVVLKSSSPMTQACDPSGIMKGENKLFQAQILEGNYHLCLSVVQDCETKGVRLHVSEWEGEFKMWPVWTAFVTPSGSSTWVGRRGRKRITIRNIEPYVFCDNYRARSQRKGRQDAFELHFVNESAATNFKETFSALMDTREAESSDSTSPS